MIYVTETSALLDSRMALYMCDQPETDAPNSLSSTVIEVVWFLVGDMEEVANARD